MNSKKNEKLNDGSNFALSNQKDELLKKEEEAILDSKNEKTKDESNKIFYGDSSKVTPVGYLDYNDFSKQTKREQKMPGFDDQYRDFVDYIIKITHNIWEEKGIGIIYDTYHNNLVMHIGSVNSFGIREIISGTLQTIHAFPDRKALGQNVIWSPMNENGFLSSHRVQSTATNLGDSNFGPATGKKITFRTTVDCACENNRIYEEWLVRDNLWIAYQMGLDPRKLAAQMVKKSGIKTSQETFGLNESMEGQFMPTLYKAKDDSVGEMMLEMTSRVYNYKLFDEVKKYYNDNAVVHYICNKDLVGYQQIQGMLVSLFASIPNGSFDVDRITCNQTGQESYDVAIRWRIRGINEGIGFFGAPSGKFVEILGISHYQVTKGKICEEWLTFDGLDVLKQMVVDNENCDVENGKE